MKEDVSSLKSLTVILFLLLLPSFSPLECEFSGNVGSQEELSVCAASFGTTVHPAAVPDARPAHQGDGPQG